MANTKEIRKQISSISNTQKITSAMEMVASSKMRKTQDRMEMGRPYADRMLSVIGHLANSNPEYKPLYMSEREVKGVGVIVVGSDKGLCGGLNINLFRTLLPFLKEQTDAGVKQMFCPVGTKAKVFFNWKSYNFRYPNSHMRITTKIKINLKPKTECHRPSVQRTY